MCLAIAGSSDDGRWRRLLSGRSKSRIRRNITRSNSSRPIGLSRNAISPLFVVVATRRGINRIFVWSMVMIMMMMMMLTISVVR